MFDNEKMKRLMLEKKLSQTELARCVGTSEAFISQACNGFKTPSFKTAILIAKELGVKADELWRDAN